MDGAPTFLFAGGGTGGHLFPGIAVAEALQRRLPGGRCVFAGSERDVESQIVATAGFEHVPLPSPPSTLIRRNPLRFLLDYHRARRAAIVLQNKLRPTVVIGLGGFASVPVVRAARRCRVPVVLLEQNAIAGRATQWLSRGAAAICHTFADAIPTTPVGWVMTHRIRNSALLRRWVATHPTHDGGNAILTGNPVRRVIAEMGCAKRKHDHPSTLLILGGSQGSTAVNEAVLSAATLLRNELRDWWIVHQTGPHGVDRLRETYLQLGIEHTVAPFFDDLPAQYASADLAVSRAGATTLAELACAAVPAVLIPYPNAVKNHQQKNAEVFARAGAAAVVSQDRGSCETGRRLAEALRPLITDVVLRDRRSAAMRSLAQPDAADRVVDCLLQIAGLSSPDHCEAGPGAPHFAHMHRESSNQPKSL